MLLDAFFRTLENEGLAVRVRDRMRVRVAFAARRDWSVPQIRGTLRVLLARDVDQRAVFDRCFDAFFHESLLVDRGPRFDTDLAGTGMCLVRAWRISDGQPAQ